MRASRGSRVLSIEEIDKAMGKSRKLKTKRMGDTLLNLYPVKFTTSFDENKRHLTDVLTITSRTIRNKIAGYITSVMNRESKLA